MFYDETPLDLVFFLRRTRTRLMLARGLDALLFGLIVGLFASILICVFGGEPRWAFIVPPVVVAIGLFRRPSLAEAAAHLDRAHHLHDLLSSAWSIKDVTREPWAQPLVREAERRITTLQPISPPAQFPMRWHAAAVMVWAALFFILPSLQRSQVTPVPFTTTNAPISTEAVTQIATASSPISDNADSEAGLPMPKPDSISGDSSHPSKPSDAPANGKGRANTPDTQALFSSAGVTPDMPDGSAKGDISTGDGRPDASPIIGQSPHGQVVSDVAPATHAAPNQLGASHASGTASMRVADAVPDVYRPLIADFFAR